MDKPILYVAIDLGTAYSGYSIKCSSMKFRDIKWVSEEGLPSCKTPSCILFNKNEEFVSFGYEASAACMQGLENGEYFFSNFKMELYRTKGIQMNLEISAVNRGKMKALKVFSETLRFFKEHALKEINNFNTAVTLLASDITWILTVPAIWDNAAKEFMREAAKQAGLVKDSDPSRLIMALEPEAASIYCKQFPCNLLNGEDDKMTLDAKPGTQFITVDCGGGTIDITVHEVLEGRFLKQVDQASGNDLGGQNIDRQFKSLLQEICGPKGWEEYVKTHTDELQEIMTKFASSKSANENRAIKLASPYNFAEAVKTSRGEELKDVLKRIDGVSWKNGYIVISPEKFKSFFNKSLSSTAVLVNDIMRKPGLRIEFMLLVGGYALCKILQGYMKHEIGSRCTILCPPHPQESVMVGAAEFGSQPDIVKSRICPLTYGIATGIKFDESKHRRDKMFVNADGETYCDDQFSTLVKRGESVGFEETRDFTFYPNSSTDTAVTFRFFSTTADDAEYVDECGVNHIDSFDLKMPDTTLGKNRKIRLKMRFGFTEIMAKAEDLSTGNSNLVSIRFMK